MLCGRDYLYLESPCRPLTCTTLACGNTNSTVCTLQSLLLRPTDCVVPMEYGIKYTHRPLAWNNLR
jgi:hypothetical protein